ncbi:MAG: F0F1 ATP synthase subunit delta [Candidatus Wildermuthbacteria bacterium]|nr:F0F1 ATP synthase subunit delta [Candidatus Wildermuthbacteria bacterium]
MQNKARLYAAVLLSSLQKASGSELEKRAKRFRDLLKKRGDLKLAANILQEFKKLWRERKGKIAEVQSAKPLLRSQAAVFRKKLQKQGFIFENKVDESAIGGVAVLLGNEYFVDNTVKGKLRKIGSMIS